jgi:hypothetical protein
MNASQQLVDSYVDRAVEEFKTNPLGTKLLRRLADELPEQFCIAAMRHLERGGESDEFRLLTILLLRLPCLPEHLSNPVLGTRLRAVAVVKRLLFFDPSFDVRLARRLPDRNGLNHQDAFKGARAFRILDILDEVSRGRRLLPVLSHLVSSDDKKLSSRATLFVGRRVQNADWAAKQLKHPDQRVRASAIESIWGLRTPTAIKLFESALEDENNRVAGNAVLGLHIAEAPGAGEIILKWSRDPRALFRSTAAWAMGRIASPGFTPELNRLLKDENPVVRSTALRALIEVRRFESHALESIASRASQLSEEEAAARATAAAEILEATVEPEFVPGADELRLDGSFRPEG